MNGVAISVRNLTKKYRGKVVLGGISLDVHSGETLALLGPNGAGKTTMVEILEGFRKRTSGRVSVLGEDPARAGLRWKARVGIVLQGGISHGNLTAREVVRHYRGFYRDAWDTDELIDAVGLSAKRDTRVNRLSGGQRRRLDVALSIVGRPEMLFLDEPTAGFDPKARRLLWGLVRTLRMAGTTILLTTHYLDEAEALADRVAVIRAGHIVDVATPHMMGGRDQVSIIRWTGPNGPEQRKTSDPSATLRSLLVEYHDGVPDLSVTRQSMEDTYLEMIGEKHG